MVVSVVRVQLGPLDPDASPAPVLAIWLRIANRSTEALEYRSWTRPELRVELRDRYGNFYTRYSYATGNLVSIPSDSAITDRVVFEPTAFQSELMLDLAVPESQEKLEFLVPVNFIERPHPTPVKTASVVPDAPPPSQTPEPEPKESKPYDPETDVKLCSRILADFHKSIGKIKAHKLGMSTNEGNEWARKEQRKLLKRLAETHNVTAEQLNRIIEWNGRMPNLMLGPAATK